MSVTAEQIYNSSSADRPHIAREASMTRPLHGFQLINKLNQAIKLPPARRPHAPPHQVLDRLTAAGCRRAAGWAPRPGRRAKAAQRAFRALGDVPAVHVMQQLVQREVGGPRSEMRAPRLGWALAPSGPVSPALGGLRGPRGWITITDDVLFPLSSGLTWLSTAVILMSPILSFFKDFGICSSWIFFALIFDLKCIALKYLS